MITKERRERLIEHAKYISSMDGGTPETMELVTIALASLEAEPELWEIVNPGEGTYYNPHGPRDYEQVETLWYKAPPITFTGDWIKCDEDMPNETEVFGGDDFSPDVLVIDQFGDIFVACTQWGQWINLKHLDSEISHWQPLPTPPKFNSKGRNND